MSTTASSASSQMTGSASSMWEQDEVVERFANREPDHRLVALLDEAPAPERLRVLDVGCAGGRNTVALAERGCDVYAVDLSRAMVAETRLRLAAVLGEQEAARRVHRAAMDDLSRFDEGTFDLVVALGVFHQARDFDEWHRAVGEAARVLRDGGRLLAASFAPGTDLTGCHGQAVPEKNDVYDYGPHGGGVLLDADRADTLFAEHGFRPVQPSEAVRVPHEGGGQRVTVNSLYAHS